MDREPKGLIRTGCLACLASGVRCKPGSPICTRNQSTQWNSNQGLTTPEGQQLQIFKRYAESIPSHHLNTSSWQGTNREVQSLHFFSIVSAPELAGYIDCAFWQAYILEAAQEDDAIKHVVAALGANHEYRLRHQASRYNKETEGLWRFALRQCNKAIKSLTVTSSHDTRGGALLRMLTASLLFVCFESMTGRKDIALSHVLHARRLTTHGKKLLRNGELGELDSVVVNRFRTMEPLVAHYSSQLSSLLNLEDEDKTILERFDIDRPVVIEHLTDARMTLYQGISYLTEIVFALNEASTQDDVRDMTMKKHALLAWFQQWKGIFVTFLLRKQGQVNISDAVHSKLLLAHYYGITVICATDISKGEDNWVSFTPQFKRILELATEIVEAHPYHAMSWQAPQTPHFSSTMNLSQPLYICAARCTDPEIAAKAVKLLGRLPPCEGAKSQFRTEIMERHLRAVTGNKKAFGTVSDLDPSPLSPMRKSSIPS